MDQFNLKMNFLDVLNYMHQRRFSQVLLANIYHCLLLQSHCSNSDFKTFRHLPNWQAIISYIFNQNRYAWTESKKLRMSHKLNNHLRFSKREEKRFFCVREDHFSITGFSRYPSIHHNNALKLQSTFQRTRENKVKWFFDTKCRNDQELKYLAFTS